MKEKDVWRKGLKVFQRFGLDKTALAADNKCKLCLAHKTIQYDQRNDSLERQLNLINIFSDNYRCEDLADTVTQPYEELNADMEAFEQRQKIHDSSQREAGTLLYTTNDKSNQGNCSRVKTKK